MLICICVIFTCANFFSHDATHTIMVTRRFLIVWACLPGYVSLQRIFSFILKIFSIITKHKPGFGTGGPDPLNSPLPPPLKKRSLNLDLPWFGGGPPPPAPTLESFLDPGIITPLLLSKLGRKFTPVKALVKEYHFGISPISQHDSWLDSRLLGTFRIQVHALLRQLHI